MKNTVLKLLLIILLVFTAGWCAGLRAESLSENEGGPGPVENIIMYSEWTDSQGRELTFSDDSTGELDGMDFQWTSSGDRLELSCLPQSELSAAYTLEFSAERGVPLLSLGGDSFSQLYKEPAAEKEPEPEPGEQLAEYAAGFAGAKYFYGGKTPETGFDCSGLVYYVFDQFGYSLNRVASEQAKQGVHVEPEDIKPGDILCFYKGRDYIGHVGIYLGDRSYVHAMGSAYGVVISSLDDPFLKRKFEARRIVGCRELMKKKFVPLEPEERFIISEY